MNMKQSFGVFGAIVFLLIILVAEGAKKKLTRKEPKPVTFESIITVISTMDIGGKGREFYLSEEVQSRLMYSETPYLEYGDSARGYRAYEGNDLATVFTNGDMSKRLDGLYILSDPFGLEWYVNIEDGNLKGWLRYAASNNTWTVGYGHLIEEMWKRKL